jgi:DNA modification methylase
MTNANVLYAVRISDYLREGDEEVSNARGPAEALQIIAKRQEQIAQNLLAKTSADKATRTLSDGESWDDIEDKYEDVEEPGALDEDEDPDFVGDGDAAQLLRGLAEEAQASAEDKPKKVINLSKRIYLGDSLELLKGAPAESFGACITDPPYGIDMDNLDQENLGNKNVELIRATHEVGENLALLKAIIPHIYRVLQKDAFFVFWYDLDHHEKLQTWCKEAGFSTQRWPLVWSKTSPCKNGQAHINFTKNYEVAMVCRKGTPKLQKPETSSIWVGSLDTLERSSGHPFVKPYALWEWIINATCPKGVRILEPFAGHGSAVRACARLGYDFVAIETLDEVYNGLIGNMKSFYRMAYAEYDIKFD